jgi:hypothetical protein
MFTNIFLTLFNNFLYYFNVLTQNLLFVHL